MRKSPTSVRTPARRLTMVTLSLVEVTIKIDGPQIHAMNRVALIFTPSKEAARCPGQER